jgi:hypothetical protein
MSNLISGAIDLRLLIESALMIILLGRILWLWPHGQLTQPEDWSSKERFWGRVTAWAWMGAAIFSGLAAVYTATRVPWVDNFSVLLGPGWTESTTSYLFSWPLSFGIVGAAMPDPWTLGHIRFRGSRELVLRFLPAMAACVTFYSIWRSIGALSATVR